MPRRRDEFHIKTWTIRATSRRIQQQSSQWNILLVNAHHNWLFRAWIAFSAWWVLDDNIVMWISNFSSFYNLMITTWTSQNHSERSLCLVVSELSRQQRADAFPPSLPFPSTMILFNSMMCWIERSYEMSRTSEAIGQTTGVDEAIESIHHFPHLIRKYSVFESLQLNS